MRAVNVVVEGIEMDIALDPTTRVASIVRGSLAKDLVLVVNTNTPGRLRFAAASAVPMRGIGVLVEAFLVGGDPDRSRIASVSINEGAVPAVADADLSSFAADSDLDGITDLAEILAGTDPLADDTNRPRARVRLTVDGVVIGWNATPGRTYRVEFTATLAHGWQTLGQPVIAQSETVEVADPAAVLRALRFYRVV